jgi:hypothetical protein
MVYYVKPDNIQYVFNQIKQERVGKRKIQCQDNLPAF